ncbi:MAG: tRNA lysidine(34) synthetase TilS [Anaerolineae bacterium]|nr:tRNA lysidine(34) synthetase TilS [Anaerolineae bacterium]
MDPLARELAAHFRDLMSQVGLAEGGRLLVALSGGPDSLCLAHLLWGLRAQLSLEVVAAHLDHGIRQTSAAESDQVSRLCEAWGMPCLTERADVPALAADWGVSLEVAARRARYAFLAHAAHAQRCPAIAVAHHADDQVETVLLCLLRGAGPGGLGGMRPVALLDPAFDQTDVPDGQRLQLVRPLLGVPSDEIEAYCRRNGLVPIRDASNRDQSTPRNWLRHMVIPALKERVPSLTQRVGRTADILAVEDDLIVELAAEAWSRCVKDVSQERVILDLQVLRHEHLALVRRLIRSAYGSVTGSLHDLSWRHVRAVEELIANGQVGSIAMLPVGIRAEIGYDRLFVGRGTWPDTGAWRPLLSDQEPVTFSWPGIVRPPGCDWRLEMRTLAASELPAGWRRSFDKWLARLDASLLPTELMLRARRPGDRLRPLGMEGTQSVQDLFVDRRIPKRWRDQAPLLVAGEAILWVIGCRLAADAAITDQTTWVLELKVVRDDV